MEFKRSHPSEELKDIVECYWSIMEGEVAPSEQKIIPDGFPEIIFHFGDPYKIKIGRRWKLQSESLLAGQITGHFYLQNTGQSDILGIKFKPAALTHLFNISMHELTNHVVDLNSKISKESIDVATLSLFNEGAVRIEIIENALKKLPTRNLKDTPIEKAVECILSHKGMTSVTELCDITGISERQLERIFKKYIGVPPKFYARIIRFSHIFELVKDQKLTGSELVVAAGFYDQSHFIKNFQAFTGEDPSLYSFDDPTLANFFLKK